MHYCLHWAQGTDRKRSQLQLQLHYCWWILGVWVQLWDEATVVSVEDSNFMATKERTTSSELFFWGGGFHWRHPAWGICSIRTDSELWPSKAIEGKRSDKWRNNSWAMHHDNALAHASLVRQFLASINMTVMPYPPYSLDLTPCEFFLFPKMKLKLKGQHFDSIKEIHA